MSSDPPRTTVAPEITSAMLEEEIGWHEDNIQIDFMTVDDLRRLLQKNGHKMEADIYRESATLVASMVEDSPIESFSSSPTPSSSEGGSFTQLVANTFGRTGSFESRPSPSAPTPLTLSLGSWSISEEEFPLYIGSAAGILLLLFVLLSATTWRCLAAGDRKRRRRQEDLEKRLNSPSLLSSNSHVHHISSDKDRFIINVHTMSPPPVVRPPTETPPSAALPPKLSSPVPCSTPARPPVAAVKPPEEQPPQETLQPNELLAQIIRNDLNKKKSHDSMVCLSGSRIESRIIDPYGKEDGHERNQLLREDGVHSSPQVCQGSRIVTDVDDVIGISSPNNSSQLDEMNTYVKLAPVVDNFLASQATFHTFQPPSRLAKKQSSDGMSSSKTSPNELDMEGSLTASEMAELQEEARDTFRSLPYPGRRLHSDLFNGNLSLNSGESYSSLPDTFIPGQHDNNNFNINNNNNHVSAQSAALEDLYSKVDYNSKLKNRCPQDGVAVVSPLPPPVAMSHKSPSPSLLSFSKQQTSLCEDDEEVQLFKAPSESSSGGMEQPTLLYNIRTSL